MINRRRVRVTMRTKRPLRVFICLLLMVSLMASAVPLFASPTNSGTNGAETATEDAGGRLIGGGTTQFSTLTPIDGSVVNVRGAMMGGGISGAYIWIVGEGSFVTVRANFSAIPSGYRLAGWETTPSVELSGTENPSEVRFVMPGEDLTIAARFEPAVPAENYRDVTVINGSLISGGTTTEIGSVVTVRGDQSTIPPRYRRIWVPSVPVEFIGNAVEAQGRSWTAQFIMPDTDVTLTYVVEPIPPELLRSLTKIVDDGSHGSPHIKTVELEYGTWIHLVNHNPPEGYRFVRWDWCTPVIYYNVTEKVRKFLMPDRDITITAVFEPGQGDIIDPVDPYHREVTITGGTVTGGAIHEIGSEVEVIAQAPGPDYQFMGWEIESSLEFIATDNPLVLRFIMPDTDITIRAVFERVGVVGDIMVDFDLDGGTSSTPVRVSIPRGSKIGLSNIPVPTRGGDTFLGWQRDGTGPILSSDYLSLMEVTEDMSFTATWSSAKAEIIFELNGGTYNHSTNRVIRQGALNQEIGAANVPSPTHGVRTLLGWQRDGVGPVLSPEAVAEMTVESSKLFVAVWEPPILGVGFHFNGGTFNGIDLGMTIDVPYGSMITLVNVPLVTKSHFELVGWQIGGTGQIFTRAQVAQMVVDQSVSFTAVWTAHDYFVVFDLKGGTVDGSTANVERLVNHGETLGATVPVLDKRNDANFLGWRNQQTGVIYTSGEVAALEITAPMAFVAVWDIETPPIHNITFNLAGGAVGGNSSNVTVMVESGSRLSLGNVPTPAHPKGYAFLGWRLNDTGNLLTATQISNMVITAPLTFVAQWSIPATEDIEVWFDLNHGNINGNAEDIRILRTSGEIIGVDAVPLAPQRGNHTFLGWQLDGIGAILTREQVGEKKVNGLMIFSAAWERHRHPVIFQMSQMEGLVNVQLSIEHGERVVPDSIPATNQTGYEFRGWRLNEGNELLTNAQVAAIDIVGPTTFTPSWESIGNNNQPGGGNQTPGTGGGGNNQTPGAGGGGNNQIPGAGSGGSNQPPAGGGNNQPPALGGGTGPTAPQTGDENSIGLWLLLAIFSLASVVAILGKRAYNKKGLEETPKIVFDNDTRRVLEETVLKRDSFLEGWKR